MSFLGIALADLHYLNPVFRIVASLIPGASIPEAILEEVEPALANIEPTLAALKAALATPEGQALLAQAQKVATPVGAIIAKHMASGATADEATAATHDQLAPLHGMTPEQLRAYEMQQIGDNSQFHGVI